MIGIFTTLPRVTGCLFKQEGSSREAAPFNFLNGIIQSMLPTFQSVAIKTQDFVMVMVKRCSTPKAAY
jgi:hypothetical protein